MLAFALSLAMTTGADAKLTIYSYQASALLPRQSHLFATLERGGKTQTISWMPAKDNRGKVLAVDGRNWTLDKTMTHAKSIDATISTFGPYQVDARIVDAFAARVKELESGQLKYTVLDNVRSKRAVCCVTAVGGIQPGFIHGVSFGDGAARDVVKHLKLR